ncbi:SART-1 protein [Phycomyces blakesleeanus]
MAESISLEETNALRLKLGLPVLGEEAEDTIDPDQVAYDNFQKVKEDQKREAKAAEIKERIEKSKNRKKNLERLQGKGLGEDDGDDSALGWIRKSRKREKELAEKRARELAEMDESFGKSTYDASHLSGLKIGHDLEEFNEGTEMILTLKDRGILSKDGEEDNEEDELTNIQVEEKERLHKNLDNKKKKPGYNPYDDEEFLLGGIKKSVLPQYEDEVKRQGFSIGASGTVDVNRDEDAGMSVSEKLKAQTLAYEKTQEIKDYYTQEEVNLTFKKPKKKKKKTRRRVQEDDEPIEIQTTEEQMEVKEKEEPRNISESNFVDDDDLQEALSRARRAANKQRQKTTKKMTPEEIAREIAQSRDNEKEKDDENEDQGGLVISQTSEFVNALGNMPAFIREPLQKAAENNGYGNTQAEDDVADEKKDDDDDEEDNEENNVDNNFDDDNDDYIEKKKNKTVRKEVLIEAESESENKIEVEAETQEDNSVMEEPLINRGLASTLSLLSQKGFITKPTESQLARDRQAAEQIRWQNEAKKREHQRERERERDKERDRLHNRESNRGRDHDRERAKEREREREREKEIEEKERLREFEKRMTNYKPSVKLEYVDEHGRQMNTKEAFRFMSHKFHGKTSGKTKTEKRLQKIEEELKLNMMSSTDTPLNLASALLERQKRSGAAHVVLSVGNRGVVPPETTKMQLERQEESKDSKGKKRSADMQLERQEESKDRKGKKRSSDQSDYGEESRKKR